jgi:6-phosphogluconolactonase
MRMKFNKSGQLLLVSAASLLVAGLVTACSTLTVDFVFVTSSKAAGSNNYGEVDVFEVNSESGFMRQIPTSPFPSGGRNPVADAVSTDYSNLYVVNQDDNTIVQFIIGNDGKLYPQNTVNTPGVYPLAIAVGGSNLFVVDTYQPLPSCSSAAPCSGSLAVFPVTVAAGSASNGALQTKTPINACNGLDYVPLALTGLASGDVVAPTAVGVLKNGSDLFVSAYDTTANTGYVFGFSIGTLSCPNNPAPYTTIPTLTPLAGSPFAAGTNPSAVASDPSSSHVYVTDLANGNVLGYAVTGGLLSPLSGSPFPAGSQPDAIAVDASGKFAYVANSLDSTVTAYSIGSGPLTRLGSYATGLQPVAIGIDPSMHQYLYTLNYLGSNVSGFELNADGTLFNSMNSPYPSNAQPTAVAAIPHNGSKQ